MKNRTFWGGWIAFTVLMCVVAGLTGGTPHLGEWAAITAFIAWARHGNY